MGPETDPLAVVGPRLKVRGVGGLRVADASVMPAITSGNTAAPVMAIAIAGIGCRQGMLVEGDVLSLGERVTSAVVQAIFAIILIDAIFALIYMELDL